MFAKLWYRFREAWRRQGAQLEDGAVENALLEHEQAEREKRQPMDLPPGRNNTDWTYVPPP